MVTLKIDGALVGTLTAPNVLKGSTCRPHIDLSGNVTFPPNVYDFSVKYLKTGSHKLEITATYPQETLTQELVYVANNPPVLRLDSPLEGAQITGIMTLRGSVTTDKGISISTVASVGDRVFLQTSDSILGGTFDFTGFAAGAYLLRVKSTDADGVSTTEQITVNVR